MSDGRLRYPSPAEQMADLAREARLNGLAFEDWWNVAVRPRKSVVTTTTPPPKQPAGAVLWPSDSADGKAWREATEAVKGGWRRAYEDMPSSRPEKALKLLSPILDAIAEGIPAREQVAA